MFVGSEDVLVQLPEDSQRFDAIDERWRNLMKIATDQPIVIESCCVEGCDKLLESLKKDLDLCEKSLNQFLETKKMAFPRFIFYQILLY